MPSVSVVGLSALFASSGCATVSVAQSAPTGTFQGPTNLILEVSSPVSRRLPPENGQGVSTVSDSGNGTALLTVQLRAGGQRCTLQGQFSGGRMIVQPGQRCTAAIDYNEIPFEAQVEVSQGVADIDGGAIDVTLGGTVSATSLNTGRNFQGIAYWMMHGVRAP